MSHWLIVCNPERWRIFDAWSANGVPSSWRVNRRIGDISAGDNVALWVGAPAVRGIYALGRVAGEPQLLNADDADAFWVEGDSNTGLSMPIELTDVRLTRPLVMSELASNEAFSNSNLFKSLALGNPHSLTDGQWHVMTSKWFESDVQTYWNLEPGESVKRSDLHRRLGGSVQDGITASQTTPNVFVFSYPGAEFENGYRDTRLEDGSILYTGQGRLGDQQMTRNNKRLLEHASQGRTVRYFKVEGGEATYLGAFAVDPESPYLLDTARDANGDTRRVFRFRLIEAPESALAERSQRAPISKGHVVYRMLSEDVSITPAEPFLQNSELVARATSSHNRLTNLLADWAQSNGLDPLSSLHGVQCDVAWTAAEQDVLIEAKSLTITNETKQLRLGLGQLLDYVDEVTVRSDRPVKPVLFTESRPIEHERWVRIAERCGVTLLWPGREDALR